MSADSEKNRLGKSGNMLVAVTSVAGNSIQSSNLQMRAAVLPSTQSISSAFANAG